MSSYKDTLNLPKTDFPMKAGLTAREPEILAKWEKGKLYERIQEARKGARNLTSSMMARRSRMETCTWVPPLTRF